MKKLFTLFFISLINFCMYAERPTIFGLTFGMTKPEVKALDLDKAVETPLEAAFDAYTRDVEVEVGYDKYNRLDLIYIESRWGDFSELFQAMWMQYFIEKLNCKHIENVYYNDEIVAVIYHRLDENGKFEGISIEIGEVTRFNDIMDKAIKGDF